MIRPWNAPVLDLGTVDTSLAKLGMGALVPESVAAHPGRHPKCSGVTSGGRGVFVKRETVPGLARVRAVENLPLPGVHRPALLGIDEEERLVVHELLAPAVSADELVRESRFGPGAARDVGKAIGALHRASPPEPKEDASLDPETLVLPPAEQLDALPLSWYTGASGAEVQLWRLLQRDAGLCDAVRALRCREREVRCVPAHCDVRLDQFLFADGAAYLVDWEEFRVADAARDIGALLGEWLFEAMATAYRPVRAGGRPAGGPARVAAELGSVQPVMTAFWLGYCSVRAPDDPGLPQRAASFAGWHLLDRLLTHGAGMVRLGVFHHAVFGLARTALLAPADLARLTRTEEFDGARG